MAKESETDQAVPHILTAEAAQMATEDAVDQFCWTIAQTLKRILGLAPSNGDGKPEDAY
jgi:hypothetical protein